MQNQLPSHNLLQQAEAALEKKNLSEAYRIYMDLRMPAHAAFTKILEPNLDEALALYEITSESPAQKWGIFL